MSSLHHENLLSGSELLQINLLIPGWKTSRTHQHQQRQHIGRSGNKEPCPTRRRNNLASKNRTNQQTNVSSSSVRTPTLCQCGHYRRTAPLLKHGVLLGVGPGRGIATASGCDRGRLERVHGRSRRDQLALAERFGIAEFPAPSGGCCYLADPNFARRLRDLIAHRGRDGVRVENILFLKVGRHFRLGPDLKLILGRDEAESRFLEERSEGHWTCLVADRHGALGWVEGSPDRDRMESIASLAARYSARRNEPTVEVVLRKESEEIRLRVPPAEDGWARSLLV